MNILKGFGKYVIGTADPEEVAQIPAGELFIVRPGSSRGYLEHIYKDAAASIRRCTSQYNYQLVVTRAFEEGEEQFIDSEEADELANNEKTFLLDEALEMNSSFQDGRWIITWKDLSGDADDYYKFACDQNTSEDIIHSFRTKCARAQYERKHQRNGDNSSEMALKQFMPLVPLYNEAPSHAGAEPADLANKEADFVRDPSPIDHLGKQVIDNPEDSPDGIPLKKIRAELHLFNASSGVFILQEKYTDVVVFDIGDFNYMLKVASRKRNWLVIPIEPAMNPVFSFEQLSFIFNYWAEEDSAAFSWLLRFSDMEGMEDFQEALMKALWQHLNKQKWEKIKTDDQEYILEAFHNDIEMADVEGSDSSKSDSGEENLPGVLLFEGLFDDVDEFAKGGEDAIQPGGKEENSQLAVGYKHNRSFVVRGGKIGVFRHTEDNNLEFDTTISKVQIPRTAENFSPSKVMLHNEDSSMILQNPNNNHQLYRMDLEYGRVVDEWKVHDDVAVNVFAPENKFAQTTPEQTLLGLSRNALYRIDPRLAGSKLVDSEMKQYVAKNDFSAMATTAEGHIAVASNKGDIRLFDRLGINAKTHIPQLGEPIIGLDVTADGEWILATCRTYLLLVDARIREGKNQGKIGFEKSFGKDSKPRPRRLQLSPQHVALMAEIRQPLSFTPARFNTGPDAKETSIVTSSGSFVVTWNFQKVKQGKLDVYQIKKYAEVVKADNFKFGSDKNVIVALPHDVGMISKRAFRKPTRESISTPVKRAKELRSPRNIVDSPY